jgi:YggT family protein
MRVLFFLLEVVFFCLVGAALLRAWMNHLRINMSGQPGRLAMALTQWLVSPVRRLLPASLGRSRVDWGSLVSAFVLALGYGGLWLLLVMALAPGGDGGWLNAAQAVPLVAVKLLLRVMLQGLMVILLLYAVLSWVQPVSPVLQTLGRLCEPFLVPIRRVVPLVGGVDLSALLLIVLLQVGLLMLG